MHLKIGINEVGSVEFIETPNAEQITPIVEGVVSHGESLVVGNSPKKHVFHFVENKQLIGGIVGARQYNRYYLSHIWVAENYRNSGHGSKLLNSCEEKMRSLGCTSVVLETLNKEAVTFYLKNGYTSISTIPEYVQGFDLVHLLKKI